VSGPIFIGAASYLGPEGFGNDRTGLRAWPQPLAEQLQQGELDGLHWSLVSESDPSRFLRMDLMCRLGFLAAELLEAIPDAGRDRIGVCVESFTGSLDTDIRFALTPRPSLFAYTLPSTVIGEICIRFQLKGPVLALISPNAEGAGALTEAADWLRAGDAEMVLCLSIEAMNRGTMKAIAWPESVPLPGWHAGALLLGGNPNCGRADTRFSGPLAGICRDLCLNPQRA